MHFEYSWVFLSIPLFLLCEWKCPLRLDLLYFPHVERIAKTVRNVSLMQAFKWMVWSGTIVALASIVQKENKFETLKEVLKRFIEKRRHDRLGLVVFGEFAYVASPVTFDHAVLAAMVPYLEVGMAGERTAIYDAMAMGTKLLKDSEAKSKVMILLTDGRNTAGKIPLQVAEKLLEQYNIKLYTIGVGRSHDYDPVILKQLAEKTGGKFFSASNPNMLEKVYAGIDALEPSEVEQQPVTKTTYLYSYPLFVAAMSLLAYLFLLNRSEAA